MSSVHLSPPSDPASRPSFFEIYASEQLNSTLLPAVRFALDILSIRHPRYIRPIARRCDSIFTGVLLFLEGSQLLNHSSLLTESFYSLYRCSTSLSSVSSPQATKLSRAQVVLSLILDVICPYLKIKLDALHSRNISSSGARSAPSLLVGVGDNEDEGEDEESTMFLMRKAFAYMKARNLNQLKLTLLKLYPHLKSFLRNANVLMNLLYVYKFTDYFSLSLLVQRLALKRTNSVFDIQSILFSSSDNNSTNNTNLNRLMNTIKSLFIASIFAFRFIQYYYQAESSLPSDNSSSVIPPPDPLLPAEGTEAYSTSPGTCPICLQNRVNSTVCLTSGYVYCYLCIVPHVEQSRKCPVTLAPTSIQDLVRIYEQNM